MKGLNLAFGLLFIAGGLYIFGQAAGQTCTEEALASALLGLPTCNSLYFREAIGVILAIIGGIILFAGREAQPIAHTPAAQAQSFCQNCGAKMQASASFCSACGAKA